MKHLFLLLSILFTLPVFAEFSEVDYQKIMSKSIMSNGGFENDKARWTASGGAFAIVSGSATGKINGNKTATWDASAAAQTLVYNQIQIAGNYAGLAGQNGVALCKFQNPSGTATHSLVVFDSVNNISAPINVVTTGSSYTFVNFKFPALNGIVQLFVQANAANEPIISIDDCAIARADEVNINAIYPQMGFQTFPLVTTGFGTLTASNIQYARVNDSLYLIGYWTNGTVAASIASVALPSGLSIDTNKMNKGNGTGSSGQIIGRYGNAVNPNIGSLVTATGTDPTKIYFGILSGANNMVPGNGNDMTTTGTAVSIIAGPIPIQGWGNTGTGYNANTTAQSWSGYHDSTCSWSGASGTFADPTGDATCVFGAYNALNGFGTVTSTADGTGPQPGFAFNAPGPNSYLVIASAYLGNTTGYGKMRLTDGTTIGGEVARDGANSTMLTASGIFNSIQAGSKTIKLQIANGGGTTTIGGTGATTAPATPAVTWTIIKIGQMFPNPVIIGQVKSSSQGGETFARARIANNGTTASITSQSGNWLTGATRNATGNVTLPIAAGTFSAEPTCTCTVYAAIVGGAGWSCMVQTNGTTSNLYYYVTHDGGGAIDKDVNILCTGPN